MARQPRLQSENAIYHVRSLGNLKQPIFLDDGDRTSFLKVLRKIISRHGLICHAYCLMNTHYHLLIQTPYANLSLGLHDLNGIYTQLFNFKHSRGGHVLGGRFHSSLVDDDPYLLTLIRYIPLNPVAAGLVTDPGEWKWSSFNTTCGIGTNEDYVEGRLILSYFNNSPVPQEAYRHYVLDGIPLIKPKVKIPPLRELVSKDMPKDELTRNIARAFFEFEYSQREIAAVLGISHTTVARRVRRWCGTNQTDGQPGAKTHHGA